MRINISTAITFCILSFLIGYLVFKKIALPELLDERASALGWMQYDSDSLKLIPKPDKYWDLKYLKYGTMK